MTHNSTPNAPRVALCISGQPRSFEAAFPYIKKNLIDCNPNVDVFLHFWYDEKNIGKEYKDTSDSVKIGGIPIEMAGTPERIKELYEPVCIQYEPQEDFSADAQRFPDIFATNKFSSLSMWTSIYRCNELKRNYERETGNTYDYVIRMRFDVIILVKILVKNIEKEFIHSFPLLCLFDEYGKKIPSLSDQILISSSRNMDVVSSLIDDIFIYLPGVCVATKTRAVFNESILYYYVTKNNIPIKTHWSWHTILVRKESARLAISRTIFWYIKVLLCGSTIRLLRRNKITRSIYLKIKSSLFNR